jgi:hypothetical protein
MYPSLQKFLIESALYKHVGLNFETLEKRPYQEVSDYVTIVMTIINEENRAAARQRAQNSGGGRR